MTATAILGLSMVAIMVVRVSLAVWAYRHLKRHKNDPPLNFNCGGPGP